jgi:pSer/pThr/pTyr-binding forkhead associated (FHA) protein
MYVLIVQSGKYQGKKIKLAGTEVVIGRDEEAAVRIGSGDVSRHHCLLTITDDGVLARDLGSRNGSFIDGAPISSTQDTPLKPGSELTVGPMTFRLVVATAKTPRPGGTPAKQQDGSLSDDDIATWLTDTDHGDGKGSGDTTIITGREAPAVSGPAVPIPPPKKREFKSVAEEAADIIRRHQESLGGEREGSE